MDAVASATNRSLVTAVGTTVYSLGAAIGTTVYCQSNMVPATNEITWT